MEMAHAICASIGGVTQAASVQILSTAGKPIAQPQLLTIELVMEKRPARFAEVEIRKLAPSYLERVDEVSEKLIRGEVQVS